MASLRGIDIGIVTSVNPRYVRRHSVRELVGVVGSYPQDMRTERITFDVQGFLDNPTQAERESINSLRDGNPSVVMIAEEGLYGWAKVIDNDFTLREGEAGIWNYRIPLFMIPCVGTMKMLHADGRFSDLNYFSRVKSMDPFATRCNVTLASALLHQHEFYIFNSDLVDTNTLEFEIMCGDDVIKVELWGWKNSGWDVIGAWHAAGTAFGATAAWTDEDAQGHTFRVDHDVRGEAVTNFTKDVSYSLGTQRRVMVQISNMIKLPVYGLSTEFGKHQLLLRVKMTHTERESGRSYAIVTYEDGGFGLGPA